jgi:GLPGLI family protein
MKRILFLTLLPFILNAQKSMNVKYQSTMTFPNIGQKQNLYNLHVFDKSSFFVFLGKDEKNSINQNTPSSNRFNIVKDLKARKIYAPSQFGTIEDSLILMSWQLDKSQKVILGYSCKKATCTFRGRNYEAFYAEKIPISNGPFKFGGLPGLILEISSTDKFIRYEAVQIDKTETPPFQFPLHWLKKTISFKTMLEMEELANLEAVKKQESRLPPEQQGLIITTIHKSEQIESVP